MSGTGVGRGRGWLNLNKSQNPGDIRPGPVTSPALSSGSLSDNSQFVNVNEYSDLINKVKQLNVNDDGIKFNQKIKYIIENWMQDCPTTNEVENSFDSMHQAALHDPDLASKLVLMVSSRTFIKQKVHEQNIRLLFVKRLQENYEACMQLQQADSESFRTSVQMMGDFYNKARLANGKQLNFMAAPLVAYLEMLLDSAQPQDLKLFTAQLYLNGASIKSDARSEPSERLTQVMNKVRLVLATDKKISTEGRLWLMLALEVASNRFALLSTDVHNFYQEQLGDVAMASFQGTHGALSVQTAHNSKTLDSYQSSVNVLQVSTASESTGERAVSPQPSFNDFNPSQCLNLSTSGFVSDSGSQKSSAGRNENSSAKTGRPILGSGARLHRHKEDGGDGRGNRKTGNWDKVPPRSSSKGWEHDDRFDTDYS